MSIAFRSPAAWVCGGILAAIFLVGPGPACGQQPKPTTSDYLRNINEQMTQAERDGDPTTRRITRYFRGWFVLAAVATVVGVVLVVLKFGVLLLFRSAPTTDPEKLAAGDPWVRAYLAQKKAAEAAEAPPQP